MYKILSFFTVVSIVACSAQPINVQVLEQKKQIEEEGEKKMATLLWSEQFEGFQGNGTYQSLAPMASRGWNTNAGDGWFFEQDTTLNKVVLYNRWTNGRRGMPDGGSTEWMSDGTIGKGIPAAAFNTGITVYYTTKWHNFIFNGNGSDCHGSIVINSRGGEGNGPGEIVIDPLRRGKGNTTWPVNDPGKPDRNFTIMNNGYGYSYRYIQDMSLSPTPFLEDDKWYEVVVYIRLDNGGQNQRWALWRREYGSGEAFHKDIDITGQQVHNVAPTSPYVGLGGYFHSNSSQAEVRQYTGFIQVYDGDAMADGNIGDGGGTDPDNGGGTEPTDPLAITNHKVTTSTTSAQLTWDTNKPSNTVVDYGSTPTRGTMAYGNDNATNHVVNLSGLTANTTYYYRYSSRTPDGSETVMDQANSTFITKTAGDTTKPVISGINVIVDTTTASVTWATDEKSSSTVEYGTTTAYDKSATGNGGTTNHLVNISSLAEGTQYNYRVKSADASGNEAVSNNAIFTTLKTPVTDEVALDDLTDVAITTPAEGQVLMYRGGKWVNIDAKPLVAQLVEDILNETSLVVNKT